MAHVIAPDMQLYELGEAWTGKNGLGDGTVLVLQRVGTDDRWSEDGTNTPDDATNRMKVEINVGVWEYSGEWEMFVSINVAVSDGNTWRYALWIDAEQWGATEEPHYTFGDVFAGHIPIMYVEAWDGYNRGFLDDEWPWPYETQIFTRKEEAPADAPPGEILNLVADSPAWHTVQLSWDEYWSAETYDLERRFVGEGNWITVATALTDLAFIDEQRPPGTLHEYRVRGVNEFGAGDWSQLATVQTLGRIAGTVHLPDGTTPAEGASVKVESAGSIVAAGAADETGAFDFSVSPGIVAHVLVRHEDENGHYQALSFPFIAVAGTAEGA